MAEQPTPHVPLDAVGPSTDGSRITEFRALHHAGRPFVLPNAWDVASALLLRDAGFRAIGTTSLGVTAAAGVPDGTGAGRELTLALARTLAERLDVPLTVDIEGGYGEDPSQVTALAAELAAVGVAGINLEDGRADGSLRPVEQHATIVHAVVAAVPGLFVNARTDTYWLGTGTDDERLSETLGRVTAYREGGAHGVFVPGLTDLADTARVAAAAQVPLNVLWRFDVDLGELADAGVARVSTGSALYRHALAAAVQTARRARGDRPAPTGPVEYGALQERILRT